MLRMSGSITQRPLYVFMACGLGPLYLFTLHAVKEYDRGITPHILKSSKMQWSNLSSYHLFLLGNNQVGIDWLGGWVGPGINLKKVGEKKYLALTRLNCNIVNMEQLCICRLL